MKLNIVQIKAITNGAVCVTQEADGFHFFRFTEEQQSLYREKRDISLSRNTVSTAGVQMRFRTDSRSLFMRISAAKRNNRNYFAMDVLVNNQRIGAIQNFDEENLPQLYPRAVFPFGQFLKEFDLGEGTKEVKILFPWSAETVVQEMTLEDGAMLEGIKPERKLLCFGDSITQGYDALHPANRYAAKLAASLDAEEFNKAIGGEQFFPELAKAKDAFAPEYILVAYGTNSWTWATQEKLTEICRQFYKNLAESYPAAKIFALSPIWRKDCGEMGKSGRFEDVGKIIQSAVEGYENITFISAFDFVPHQEQYFGDMRVHPNDMGFEQYHHSLIKAIGINGEE